MSTFYKFSENCVRFESSDPLSEEEIEQMDRMIGLLGYVVYAKNKIPSNMMRLQHVLEKVPKVKLCCTGKSLPPDLIFKKTETLVLDVGMLECDLQIFFPVLKNVEIIDFSLFGCCHNGVTNVKSKYYVPESQIVSCFPNTRRISYDFRNLRVRLAIEHKLTSMSFWSKYPQLNFVHTFRHPRYNKADNLRLYVLAMKKYHPQLKYVLPMISQFVFLRAKMEDDDVQKEKDVIEPKNTKHQNVMILFSIIVISAWFFFSFSILRQ